MSLDINKIINESILETLEEADVLEEVNVKDMAKEHRGKLGAAAGAAATGAGVAAYQNRDEIAKGLRTAADTLSSTAKEAVEKGEELADKGAKAVTGAATAAGQAAKEGYEEAKETVGKYAEKGRKSLRNAIMTDKEEAQLARGGKKAVELLSPEDKAALTRGNKSLGDIAIDDTKEGVNKLVKGASDLWKKYVANESTAVASAISAGLGAKTILEQLRRVSK